MKFRVLVALLTVAILVLFVVVVKKSYDLKLSETNLKISQENLIKKNDTLVKQAKTIDSLYQITEEQLESLERATDSIYFNVARNSNTFKSYRNYINNFGDKGEYYHAALTNINGFFPKKGYVQIQESNGRKYYTEFKETKGFPEEPLYILNEPSATKTNLIVLKQTLSVRAGVIGNPEFSNTARIGDAVWDNQIVKLLDVFESGNAKWGYIAYGNK